MKRAGSLVLLFLGFLLSAGFSFAQQSTTQVAASDDDVASLPVAPAAQTSSSSSTAEESESLPDAKQNASTPPSAAQNAPAQPDQVPGDKGARVHYKAKGHAELQNGQPPPLDYGQQPKRIMGWIPNYRAVSVGAKPPPPTFKEKFLIGTQNTFDYSAFIFNAVDSEIPYVTKSYPEFGNGMVGYGRYYWHGFVDKGVGNYMTDTIVPTLTRQDSRYYSLGTGHWYIRALYAYTRVLITPNDAGKNTFNYSEIVGKGAAAGIGDLYYPPRYRDWTKTGQRWLVQVAIRDGGFNVFREFWPDIAKHILHLSPSNQ